LLVAAPSLLAAGVGGQAMPPGRTGAAALAAGCVASAGAAKADWAAQPRTDTGRASASRQAWDYKRISMALTGSVDDIDPTRVGAVEFPGRRSQRLRAAWLDTRVGRFYIHPKG
jgi:hypothetical protein